MKSLPVVLVLAVAVLLTGCPKKPTTPPDAAAGGTQVPATGDQTGAGDATGGTAGAGGSGVGTATELPGGDADLLARSVIYFDFNSDAVRSDFAAVVSAHGKRIAASGARVRLEGHTDERGSAEYNNALGLRRAEAVKRALLLEGAREAQVDTTSFGEQKPAAGGEGEGEQAWSLNRRVEIVLLPAT